MDSPSPLEFNLHIKLCSNLLRSNLDLSRLLLSSPFVDFSDKERGYRWRKKELCVIYKVYLIRSNLRLSLVGWKNNFDRIIREISYVSLCVKRDDKLFGNERCEDRIGCIFVKIDSSIVDKIYIVRFGLYI